VRDSPTGDWVNYYVSRYVLTAGLLIYLLTRILRFVDRDMMMWYLGWGISHRNPPDFSHEANALVVSSIDRELEEYVMSQVDETQANAAEGDNSEIEGRSVGSGSDLGESGTESIHSEVATYDY
jgi:hypothetical protein